MRTPSTLWALITIVGVSLGTVGLSSAPATAGGEGDSGDYTQVVDLTFPLDEGAANVPYTEEDFAAPRSGGSRHHRATDIMADHGEKVYAAVGGTVSTITGMGCGGSWTGALDEPPSWGYAIYVDGDDGRRYVYLHLGPDNDAAASEAYASGITCGSEVARGEHIGYVGSSGSAHPDWPHLHLEIHQDGVDDPYVSEDGDSPSPRINPYFSLKAAEARGDYPDGVSLRSQACGTEAQDSGTVVRVCGADRLETAAAVAARYWPDGSDEVVLATARDHADAVTGSALAASRGAPLLLAHPGGVPGATLSALADLEPRQVWLLGGNAALGPEVDSALESIGLSDRTRLGGVDRYGTAALIAEVVGAPEGEIVLAPGHPVGEREAWPSAVAAGAFTALEAPIPTLLVRPDGLGPTTEEALRDLDVTRVLDVGPRGLVDVDALADVHVTPVRGADRYETSAKVLDVLAERGVRGPLIAATGADYPDALAAGALSGRVGGALALVPRDDLSHAPMIGAHVSAGDYGQAIVVGGPAAVTDEVRAQLREMMR